MESDQIYYARRAAQEARAAARAITPAARDWHQQLADKYSRKVREEECSLRVG